MCDCVLYFLPFLKHNDRNLIQSRRESKVYKEIPFSTVCCTYWSQISVNHALENSGSNEDFIITYILEEHFSVHILKPFKVHRTDSNENRSKFLERVVWKIISAPPEK